MKNNQDELIPTRWTLIEKLKNWDDQESWREFFDTYWKLIYGVAIKSGLTHPEAQDAVQETVMSVCRNMPNFKADPSFGSFKSWLLNLTRWRIVDQIRKRPASRPADTGRVWTVPQLKFDELHASEPEFRPVMPADVTRSLLI